MNMNLEGESWKCATVQGCDNMTVFFISYPWDETGGCGHC